MAEVKSPEVPNVGQPTDVKPGADAPATSENGDAKRGRKPGTQVKRPDTSGFNLDAIAGAVAAPAQIRTAAAPKIERKPEQMAMDKVAARAHASWVGAGRPAAWEKMPVITYFLDPTQVEGYKYLIRRAVDFHGTRVRFGAPARVTKKLIHEAGLQPEFEGREILAWAVLDKRPRTVKDEAKPAAPAAPAAPATAAK
jgi:hypothetical protein